MLSQAPMVPSMEFCPSRLLPVVPTAPLDSPDELWLMSAFWSLELELELVPTFFLLPMAWALLQARPKARRAVKEMAASFLDIRRVFMGPRERKLQNGTGLRPAWPLPAFPLTLRPPALFLPLLSRH